MSVGSMVAHLAVKLADATVAWSADPTAPLMAGMSAVVWAVWMVVTLAAAMAALLVGCLVASKVD